MNKQAILDVLNTLEVVDKQGGDEAYMLIYNNDDVREKLAAVGVTPETIRQYGDDESFSVLALAFGEGYCDEYDNQNEKFILWGPLDDDFRYRVLNGQGTQTDSKRLLRMLEPELFGKKAEFGTFAAHQPGYEKFKESGKLEDYAYQSLVHMQNASHQLSWALTVLDHADIPAELRDEVQKFVQQTSVNSEELQDRLRAYKKTQTV